jgi:hypothetical protein
VFLVVAITVGNRDTLFILDSDRVDTLQRTEVSLISSLFLFLYMATIIDTDTPATNRSVHVDSSDGSAGWAVAVLILVAVLVAGAFWYMRYYRAPAPQPAAPGTTVQVNLPTSGYTPATDATQ